MVDPNKKPGEKTLNVRAWERLLGHEVSALRVEWTQKNKRFSEPPVQECWVTYFVPDTFHSDAKGRWAPDLELISPSGAVEATAKLQPKAAAAAMVIPEPPLLRHRGALKPLPTARVWVWAMALAVLPQDLRWLPKSITSDERFVLGYFRSRHEETLVHPGEMLDEHLAWEEEEAERDRRAERAVEAAMLLLSEKGITDYTSIPEDAQTWRLQEEARALLDAGDNDCQSVLAAAALFQSSDR